jgi:hypothetical protein
MSSVVYVRDGDEGIFLGPTAVALSGIQTGDALEAQRYELGEPVLRK